jgi:RHS repeat-associated protein
VVARYLYDPFGSILSQSGPLAAANLYRFSSKEFHVNSGLVYYLYRFYDPNLQRWPNRDPLTEVGHRELRGACTRCYHLLPREADLYLFCANNPVSDRDPLGLVTRAQCEKDYDDDIAAAKAYGQQCAGSAAWGVIRTVGLGVLGVLGGGLLTESPGGAAGGGILGLGLGGCLELRHVAHCAEKVNEMKKWAKENYDYCITLVTD